MPNPKSVTSWIESRSWTNTTTRMSRKSVQALILSALSVKELKESWKPSFNPSYREYV
ncbi:hypothetical protein HanRHA438_Chr00c41g0856861 [Helianthus annuus]|nr:hypothetical protein HanRHA438_Chr00c41g0856861 [Helianthus annuus]